MVCLGRPYHFNFFKGCLPQILLGPFLNTLTHILDAAIQERSTQGVATLKHFSKFTGKQPVRNHF